MIYDKNKKNRKTENPDTAKKPLDNNDGSGFMSSGSGFMSSIIQGFALGTGSQLASRSIDSVFGNKKIEIENNNKCVKESELYLNCLENNEKNSCINFFDLLENCKKS